MDKKKMLLVAVITGITSLAITGVTAHSFTSNTPLYTLRMEQASNKMNFLPTAVNEFTYIAEKGYGLTYNTQGDCSMNGYCGDANPLGTGVSCVQTQCDTCYTYCGQNTCQYTCPDTCGDTCGNTCPYTCPYTCEYTCDDPTCGGTCGEVTCKTCDTTEPECESIEICP
jgi:hypothetical protein